MPQDVLVEAVIRSGRTEDLVDGLPLQTLTALTGLASYMAQWDSTGFEAGDYRLEVIVRDAGGAVLDREWTEFSLGLSLGQITSYTASPLIFEPGDRSTSPWILRTRALSHLWHGAARDSG